MDVARCGNVAGSGFLGGSGAGTGTALECTVWGAEGVPSSRRVSPAVVGVSWVDPGFKVVVVSVASRVDTLLVSMGPDLHSNKAVASSQNSWASLTYKCNPIYRK